MQAAETGTEIAETTETDLATGTAETTEERTAAGGRDRTTPLRPLGELKVPTLLLKIGAGSKFCSRRLDVCAQRVV